MILTRVLTRELGDGKAIVITRSWRIRFERTPTGYAVDGEQIAVDVDVPPRLARLAEVERCRPQQGTFPIALDGEARIVSAEPGDPSPIPGLTEAAGRYVRDRNDTARTAAMDYVAAIQQAGAKLGGQWPSALFFPAGPRGSETRRLAIPGGGEGTVTVTFDGELDRAGERLARARREIVTQVGGTTRTSVETWQLESLD